MNCWVVLYAYFQTEQLKPNYFLNGYINLYSFSSIQSCSISLINLKMTILEKKNLFIYFLAASGLSCSTQDLLLRHTGSFIAARELFVVVRGLLSTCGTQAPEHAGSVVVARGLSSCGTWAL